MWNITLLEDPLNVTPATKTPNCGDDSGTVVGHSDIGFSMNTDTVPLQQQQVQQEQTRIALCTCSFSDLLGVENANRIRVGLYDDKQHPYRRIARIALADYVARMIAVRTLFVMESQPCNTTSSSDNDGTNCGTKINGNSIMSTRIEPLDRATSSSNNGSRQISSNLRNSTSNHNSKDKKRDDSIKHITPATTTIKTSIPYILERSDVTTTPITSTRTELNVNDDDNEYQIHIYVRVFIYSDEVGVGEHDDSIPMIKQSVSEWMQRILDFTSSIESMNQLMAHVSIAVLQEKLRSKLQIQDASATTTTIDGHIIAGSGGGVAFIANGAILPRKSGASSSPMPSPPAIPFMAPENSTMHHTMHVDMGELTQFLKDYLPSGAKILDSTNIIEISGLLIPRGVSLIVGGGYHGKSTLLRCIAAGVYNKMIHDGREFCVTVSDALTVRAEDGRYVHNCNVSAFISNLPIPNVDTKHFSTNEASGSTSQASNVAEAIEMGVSAMLIDEDVSAANFMARDGRMRSLVMDESITPLLYRVNGLFRAHGISSIVVVGGVGDWLDVPDNVILLDRYICYDATAKARSISKQFSHGHVQYAGRGVVHRLNWDKGGTPLPRRPIISNKSVYNILMTEVTLLDGSNSIALHTIGQSNHSPAGATDAMCIDDGTRENDEDDDDDELYIDMSRCEQLLGKKPELYGCGLCVAWLLHYSQQHPEMGVRELLQKMDVTFDLDGWAGILKGSHPNESSNSHAWRAILQRLGFTYRPRRFEVGQALTRFRGITFVDIPIEDDGSDEAARIEAERQRNELLAIWNNRRKKNSD
jgi:predicted ABC-class ATPase